MTKPKLTEIKPHAWITTNRFFVSDDRTIIVKYHCPKKRSFRLLQYRAVRWLGYPIPYEFRSEVARCAHERAVYTHWHALGYNVPRLLDDQAFSLPPPGPRNRCIVLEFIDGEVLSELLASPAVALERKLDLVTRQFKRCGERHRHAFERRDRDLIKYDANLRNIVLRGDEFYDLDFESGRIAESLERGAAREIGRYITDSIKFVGRQHSAAIIVSLRREYPLVGVLGRIVKTHIRERMTAKDEFSIRDVALLLSR